jgi:hypothetical protein
MERCTQPKFAKGEKKEKKNKREKSHGLITRPGQNDPLFD